MTAGVWSFLGLQKFLRLGRDEGPHLSAVRCVSGEVGVAAGSKHPTERSSLGLTLTTACKSVSGVLSSFPLGLQMCRCSLDWSIGKQLTP